MKATGIVRRIDDLGRIVIPKEIRTTLHIREGAQLEIFTENDGSVIFRKYSPIGEIEEHAAGYAEILAKITGNTVAISDRDEIIAAAGAGKKDLLRKKIAAETDAKIGDRKTYVYRIGEPRVRLCKETEKPFVSVVCPIIQAGDPVGAVIMAVPDQGNAASESEIKVLTTATQLLCRQIDY